MISKMHFRIIRYIIFCYGCVLFCGCGDHKSISPTSSLISATSYSFEISSSISPTPTSYPKKTLVFTKTNSNTPSLPPTDITPPTVSNTRTLSDRYIETAGLITFSYIPPKRWDLLSGKGRQPSGWGFGIFIPSVYYCILDIGTESVPDSSAKAIADSRYNYPDSLTRSKFITDSRVNAYKVAKISSAVDGDYYTSYYFFYKDPYLVLAIYTRPRYDFIGEDVMVDQSMRTFQFE